MNRGHNMETIIKVNNLHKSYNSNHIPTDVLKGIDLEIKAGEFVSIMGPSGSGKSTLLYLIGGLETPSEGNIYINDQHFNIMNDREQSKIRQHSIGFVFQFYNLVQHLTVEENILLPVLLNGGKKKQYITQLEMLLEKVGLTDKRNSYPRELSGGQQQRVSIARALINSPKIILADEPIGNLDSKSGTEIMELFRDINQTLNTIIIQVTHNEKSAEYGNRILHVQDGKIA